MSAPAADGSAAVRVECRDAKWFSKRFRPAAARRTTRFAGNGRAHHFRRRPGAAPELPAVAERRCGGAAARRLSARRLRVLIGLTSASPEEASRSLAGVSAFDQVDLFEDLPPTTRIRSAFRFCLWLAETLIVFEPARRRGSSAPPSAARRRPITTRRSGWRACSNDAPPPLRSTGHGHPPPSATSRSISTTAPMRPWSRR